MLAHQAAHLRFCRNISRVCGITYWNPASSNAVDSDPFRPLNFVLRYIVLGENAWRHNPHAASLLLQVLGDPICQRFCRGGVLAGVQLAVNHYMAPQKSIRFLKLPSEFFELVFQIETDVLGSGTRQYTFTSERWCIDLPPTEAHALPPLRWKDK